MTRFKKLIGFAAVGVVLLILATAAGLYFFGPSGSAIENYLARQLLTIANHYLGPQISFTSLDYQYPKTVVLKNVRLTAQDAAGPVDILAAKSLTLELSEIPRVGQPVRIQQLKLDHPELRLIAAEPGSPKFLGFSNLLKNTSAPASASAAATAPASPAAKEDLRLSSIFEINLIEITGGLVVLDPRVKDQPPMQLDQINTRLTVQTNVSEPGWYALNITLARDPVFSCQALGKLNLDTALIDLEKLHVALTLGREQDHFLPPSFQQLLREHEVTGQFTLDAKGAFPIQDFQSAKLSAQLNLTGAQFALGEHKWPLESLAITASLSAGQAKLDSLKATLLGGTLDAAGSVEIAANPRADVSLRISHLQLEQTLRHATNSPSDIKGDVSGQIVWQAPLAEAFTSSRGNGSLSVTNASLAPIPALGKLFDSLQSVMKVVGLNQGASKDALAAEFSFQGNKINFTRLDLDTSFANLRGTGDFYFDKRLDLTLAGGPLDKAQPFLKNLGDIGKTLSQASNQISAYTVTGTTDDPKVGIKLAPNLSPNFKLPKF